ncbi:hypothetical protein Tco_0244213, partial [Tanacetum coccineum]
FNCHNTGHFARECKFKGTKEGSRQEAGRSQNYRPVRQIEKEALMTIDEGQINWVEQTTDEELNHALMAFTVNNEVSMCSKLYKILAEKIQQEEREQYSIEDRAKFLHDTIAAQRKFLTEQRHAAIRNKPPTISQLRNQMITYLKHVANKKHAELKYKSFEEIQVLYERYKKYVANKKHAELKSKSFEEIQ